MMPQAPAFTTVSKSLFWAAAALAVKCGGWMSTLLGSLLFLWHPKLKVSTQTFQLEVLKVGLTALRHVFSVGPHCVLKKQNKTKQTEFCQYVLKSDFGQEFRLEIFEGWQP